MRLRRPATWGAHFVGCALASWVLCATAWAQESAAKSARPAPVSAPSAGKAAAPSKAKPVAKAPAKRSPGSDGPNVKSASKSATKPSATSKARKPVVPARPSFGQLAGLHATDDPLDLKSSVALVVDPDTDQVLFSKNPTAVLPIASITKLMTALVVLDAGLSMDDRLLITQEDVDTEKGSGSRLRVGTALTRGEMLHLALMASENRAAHALGRTFPGGLEAFVPAMNRRASALGMHHTTFVEPTGLSSRNQSTARDLSLLVREVARHDTIRDLSTRQQARVAVGPRQVEFRNTNALVRNPAWDIVVQKTGYISEAGRCVVMEAQLAGRRLIMVLLDSAGRYSRVGDAERLRAWLNRHSGEPTL